MKAALLLLRPGIISIRNSLAPATVLGRSPFWLVGAGMWAGTYLGTKWLLGFILEAGPIGGIIALKLLAMVFFALSGFLLLSNLITSISAFYLSKDLPFLITKPLATADITAYKTIETFAHSTWMVLVLMPAFFMAYGAAYGAPTVFTLFAILAFVPFALMISGTGIAIGHLLTRLFPVRRTRDALMGLGLLVLLFIYFSIQSAASVDTGSFEGLIDAAMRLRTDSPLLPGFWMTETLAPLLKGGRPDPLFPFLLLSSAGFFLMVSHLLGQALYDRNYQRMNDSPERTEKRSAPNMPSRAHAFFWKDSRVFVRDPEQWSQIIIIGALLMVYVYNARAIPVEAFGSVTPFFREAATMLNLLLAGLMLVAVAARFLYVAVSIEGGMFWLVRSSPFSMRSFLMSKFAFGFVPIAVLMLFLVLLSCLLMDAGTVMTILSMLTVLLLCLSVCGLAAGLGALRPRFDYESIASVSMGLGSVTFMLAAFLLVTATVMLEGFAVYVYEKAGLLGREPIVSEHIQATAAIAMIILINVVAFYLPLKAGVNRLLENPGV